MPGFYCPRVFPHNLYTVFMAAIAIAAIGYAIGGGGRVFHGHGIVGFIVSAVVIYAVQFLFRFEGFHVGALGGGCDWDNRYVCADGN